MPPDDLIRTGEAASILGASRQHVVDLCNQGVLSYVRSPTQRRLRRSEVEAFVGHGAANAPLSRDQRQSVWLHAAVAGHLVADPAGTIARARTNLERMRAIHPTGMAARWLADWQSVLDRGPEAVLEALTARGPLAIELRQSSPFAGVLSSDGRETVLRAFRDLDRRAHA
jgi:excisionase family DNA binding protein